MRGVGNSRLGRAFGRASVRVLPEGAQHIVSLDNPDQAHSGEFEVENQINRNRPEDNETRGVDPISRFAPGHAITRQQGSGEHKGPQHYKHDEGRMSCFRASNRTAAPEKVKAMRSPSRPNQDPSTVPKPARDPSASDLRRRRPILRPISINSNMARNNPAVARVE